MRVLRLRREMTWPRDSHPVRAELGFELRSPWCQRPDLPWDPACRALQSAGPSTRSCVQNSSCWKRDGHVPPSQTCLGWTARPLKKFFCALSKGLTRGLNALALLLIWGWLSYSASDKAGCLHKPEEWTTRTAGRRLPAHSRPALAGTCFSKWRSPSSSSSSARVVCAQPLQSCPTLCDPMGHSLPSSEQAFVCLPPPCHPSPRENLLRRNGSSIYKGSCWALIQ